jgi:hypothetical protein
MFPEHEGEGPDVILMAVREDDSADESPVRIEVARVWKKKVDPRSFRAGEHDPAIHDEKVVSEAIRHHVETELAEPAERQHLEVR